MKFWFCHLMASQGTAVTANTNDHSVIVAVQNDLTSLFFRES